MFRTVKSFFDRINETKSVKEKEAILREYEDNDYIAELLHINLNPHIQLQFNKMPCSFEELTTFDKFSENSNYQSFINLVLQLKNRKVTGNAAKREVSEVFKRMDKDEFDLYTKILLKKAIGIGASTVNKVWVDHIPVFDVMLAPNEIVDVTKVRYPAFIQPKLDGYRCICKDGQFWSREGKPFGNRELPEYFANVLNVQDYVLDGELYAHGLKFNTLQTILNKEDKPLPKGLKFVVYDCIDRKQWDSQKSGKPYEKRLMQLRSILNDQVADPKKVIDIANDEVDNAGEAVKLYKKWLDKGYEGAMIKDIEGLYQWKRVSLKSGEVMKLKPFKTEDLRVTGIYDGEDGFQGMAGGVVVDYNGTAVRCGSGFDLPTRKKMAEKPDDFIGKMAEIKYLEVTEDNSLRHPSFVRWREDKE